MARGIALAGQLDFAGDGSDEGVFVGEYALTISYYLLPLNLYAGLSIGRSSGWYEDLSTNDADQRRVETESAFGYGANLGYEFLFENSAWGLGPSVRIWYSNFDNGSFTSTALVLSATHH